MPTMENGSPFTAYIAWEWKWGLDEALKGKGVDGKGLGAGDWCLRRLQRTQKKEVRGQLASSVGQRIALVA
ncbi:hypothetical protein N7468_004799 [Penicillium chermesinum]|uniref:Uncharacterized protein n=1 Tax=Penicillium chermesinum TaxID=63820 RepID=A0A9W9P9F9_9EURO|nr:uncharacterized protein N7468_004799 [Penicillium chermesinum]KAJ5240180.1 hypothetical protein N7468_004799 [Penicillium chermesinum]KAJ6167052.1 hypothetical protein N7470_002499 [Penicillium chermesinum]